MTSVQRSLQQCCRSLVHHNNLHRKGVFPTSSSSEPSFSRLPYSTSSPPSPPPPPPSSSSPRKKISHRSSRTNNPRHQQPHRRKQPLPPTAPHTTPYGTRTTVSPLSRHPHDPLHPLHPYIRHCLPSSPFPPSPHSAAYEGDTTFNILFLGTNAGGTPNAYRSASSTVLRVAGGGALVFDCGEGTQRQMAYSTLGPGSVEKVLVTHMHADHVGGLLGLILQFQMAVVSGRKSEAEEEALSKPTSRRRRNKRIRKKKEEKRDTLEIYGPPGIFNYVAMNLALTCSPLRVNVVVHELVGGQEDGRPRRKGGDVREVDYPEVSDQRLQRRVVPRGEDGRWVIAEVDEEVRYDDDDGGVGGGGSKRDPLNRKLHFGIEAAEVRHRMGVQTFGYVVREPEPTRHIDVDKARMLGLDPGPKFRDLKNGIAVESDYILAEEEDGGELEGGKRSKMRMVHPWEVMQDDDDDADEDQKEEEQRQSPSSQKKRRKRGRSFGLIGDASMVSKKMMELCDNVDVLVHEATLREEDRAQAIERGHSTPSMAGNLARETNAKVLLLNHISSKNCNQADIDALVSDAVRIGNDRGGGLGRGEGGGKGVSPQTAVAYDFMEFHVPRRGFDFLLVD